MVSDSLDWSWQFWFLTRMKVRPVSDRIALMVMRKNGYSDLVAQACIAEARERAEIVGYVGPVAWLVNEDRIEFWFPRAADEIGGDIQMQMEAIWKEFRVARCVE